MLDLHALAHHLLVEQRVNVLDKQKCSTTARNIYNHMTGGTSMGGNNNLAGMPANLDALFGALADETAATAAGPRPSGAQEARIFYVHFDHLTNDTSHYFIICKSDAGVMLLQSAVFEFSIFDWLFPQQSLAEAQRQLAEAERALGASDDPLDAMRLEQARRDAERARAVIGRISDCAYSGGRIVPTAHFVSDFLPALATLQGMWTLDRLDAACDTYRRLFACDLQAAAIAGHIRVGGLKPASVKFIDAPSSW